jgi:hypothetical protein
MATTSAQSAFSVTPDDGGYRISWGDDPLDFIWQTEEQAYAFANAIYNVITKQVYSGVIADGGARVRLHDELGGAAT